jgi:hypothetical protein
LPILPYDHREKTTTNRCVEDESLLRAL